MNTATGTFTTILPTGTLAPNSLLLELYSSVIALLSDPSQFSIASPLVRSIIDLFNNVVGSNLNLIFELLDMNIKFSKRSYTETSFTEAFSGLSLTLTSWITTSDYQLYLDQIAKLKLYFEPSAVEESVRTVLTPSFLYIKKEMDNFAEQYPSFHTLSNQIYDVVNKIIDDSLLYLYGFSSSTTLGTSTSILTSGINGTAAVTSTRSSGTSSSNISSNLTPSSSLGTSGYTTSTGSLSKSDTSVVFSSTIPLPTSQTSAARGSTGIIISTTSASIAPTITETKICTVCKTNVITSTSFTTYSTTSGTVTTVVTEPCETLTFTEVISSGPSGPTTVTLTAECNVCQTRVITSSGSTTYTTTKSGDNSIVTVTEPCTTTYTEIISPGPSGSITKTISASLTSAIDSVLTVTKPCSACVTKVVSSSGSTIVTETSGSSTITVTKPYVTTYTTIIESSINPSSSVNSVEQVGGGSSSSSVSSPGISESKQTTIEQSNNGVSQKSFSIIFMTLTMIIIPFVI